MQYSEIFYIAHVQQEYNLCILPIKYWGGGGWFEETK